MNNTMKMISTCSLFGMVQLDFIRRKQNVRWKGIIPDEKALLCLSTKIFLRGEKRGRLSYIKYLWRHLYLMETYYLSCQLIKASSS